MTEKKERQLNYELLRIVAMLMIVCLHYLGKGGLLGNPSEANMTAVGYTAWIVEAFCLVAVNVYVLISGYFGVNTQEFEKDAGRQTFRTVLKRPRKIWNQVFFYSVAIGYLALATGVQQFDLYQIFSYCFPIVTEHYWFATAYVMLCLLMPFLNAGFLRLSQKEIGCLLAGLLLIFSVSKTVLPMQLPWDKYGYDIMWFVVLYLTGAYLRRYEIKVLKTRWRAIALYLGSVAAIFASFFLLRVIWLKTGRLENLIHYGYTYNFLFCYTGAVGLFLAFRQSKDSLLSERFRKSIELLAGATFGVYLIHEHINIRSEWPKWFRCEVQSENTVAGFLVHMLLSVLCVYAVCTVIELIRQKMAAKHWIFALILLLYPLRNAANGFDLMDAGYALGNYRFFDIMGETWKLATYLANVTGALLEKLPFGDCWIGMNVYCGLMIGAAAAGIYLFLYRQYGKEKKAVSCFLFLSEFAALSLCWAPNVILYHYLGYLLMSISAVLLFVAITKDNKRYFIAAGVILGLCVAVRMPNITYMALIIPLWCYCFWNRQSFAEQTGKKHAWFQMLLRRTLLCIAGYAAGLLIPLLVICVRYGVKAYPEMIVSLFGMTDNATDYKPTAMITAMFGDYFQYSVWLLLFAAYMAAGALFLTAVNRLVSDDKKAKITTVFKMLYAAGLLVVLRFCYGRGMFNFDYSAYFSMYKWLTVYLLMALVLCIWCLVSAGVGRDLKLWAVILLVMIMVTPLGSNNGLYPIINNLFLVAPVSVLMAAEFFRQSQKIFCGVALRMGIGFMFMCITIQSVLFGLVFVFHDAGVQTGGERLELTCSQAANGLRTTSEKKTAIEELDTYLSQNSLNQKQVILYGDIPALAYIFDMEPAIFQTWVDLDSSSMDILEEELDTFTAKQSPQELPVVILGRDSSERLSESDGLAYQKLLLIRAFMETNGYQETFCNDSYRVYVSQVLYSSALPL